MISIRYLGLGYKINDLEKFLNLEVKLGSINRGEWIEGGRRILTFGILGSLWLTPLIVNIIYLILLIFVLGLFKITAYFY